MFFIDFFSKRVRLHIQLQYDKNRDLNKQKNLTDHDQLNLYGFMCDSHKHIGKKLFEDHKIEKSQVN